MIENRLKQYGVKHHKFWLLTNIRSFFNCKQKKNRFKTFYTMLNWFILRRTEIFTFSTCLILFLVYSSWMSSSEDSEDGSSSFDTGHVQS